MVRKNIKICLRSLATVLLLVLVLNSLSIVFERKDSRSNTQEFFEQKENFDVLILGTSHVFNGISPMDMWEQNGITAYNLGAPGCRIATTYWILRNALEHTKPKVVVLDCAYLLDDKVNANTGYMHTIFDGMPLSTNKIKALLDLYEQREDVLRFLFPFSLYHNRWNELSSEDFFYQPTYGKMGMTASCEIVNVELPSFIIAEPTAINNISTEYLYKIVELCKQQDVELLLTFLPFNMSDSSKNDAAYVKTFAEQHEIKYLGPEYFIDFINPETDFMNNSEDNSHLNLSGAHKVSYLLGNFISRNYSAPDQRDNMEFNDWTRYYSMYQDYKLSFLSESSRLDNYLVALADRNYQSTIYIQDKSCLQNETVENLLANLGFEIGNQGENETALFTQDSSGFDIQITQDCPQLVRNNELLHQWDIPISVGGIYILVTDNISGEILHSAVFSSNTMERLG